MPSSCTRFVLVIALFYQVVHHVVHVFHQVVHRLRVMCDGLSFLWFDRGVCFFWIDRGVCFLGTETEWHGKRD